MIEFIIYGFGKVGSMSLFRSLSQYVPSHFCHTNFRCLKHIREIKARSNRPVIINSVRNLYDRNVSGFFHNMILHFPDPSNNIYQQRNHPIWYLDQPIEILETDFFRIFREKHLRFLKNQGEMMVVLDQKPHRVIDWYQENFNPTLDVNIFDYPFKDDHIWIQKQDYDILVIRFEDIQEWPKIFKKLFGMDLDLKKVNSSQDKWYSELYRYFKENYVFSREEKDLIENCKWMKHFNF